MNDHDDNSLHKRIENLEHAVIDIQHTLSQITDSSYRKSPDLQSEKYEAVHVQAASDQVQKTALAQHVPENEDDLKPCPFCKKMINKEAIRCRYCYRMISETHDSVTDRAVDIDQADIAEEPSKTREEWEAFIGGKLLNRIGALA